MQRTFGYVALIIASWPSGTTLGEDSPVPSPQQVIGKAIEAHGGKKNLAAFANCRVRRTGSVFDDEKKVASMTGLWLSSASKSFKVITEIKSPELGMVRTVAVFNGKKVWLNENGITRDGNKNELLIAPISAYSTYVHSFYPLLDKDEFTLDALPTMRINGKDAVGICVSSKGHPDIRMYFDKKTWLLVKDRYRIIDDPIILQENYYEEYKLQKGVMCATRTTTMINGKRISETKLVDIEPLTEVEDSEFSKP